MITIATAECFTHGILAREIHALAQGYEDNFGSKYSYLVNKVQKNCLKDAILDDKCSIFDLTDLSVICGLFIPTLDAVKSILQIENPVEPLELVKGIKVYDDEGDISVKSPFCLMIPRQPVLLREQAEYDTNKCQHIQHQIQSKLLRHNRADIILPMLYR